MSLLPDIDGKGQLILSREEKVIIKNQNVGMSITPGMRIKLKEYLERKKLKEIETDKNMAELNNMGHNEVTEDFEDSPFADREKEDENEE